MRFEQVYTGQHFMARGRMFICVDRVCPMPDNVQDDTVNPADSYNAIDSDGYTCIFHPDSEVERAYPSMSRAQVIASLRDMLAAANASDSGNSAQLGGNDLPAECASDRTGLYGYAMGALISLGQGPSYAHYVRTGEWIDTEQLSQDDLSQIENDVPGPRKLVNADPD